MPYPRFLTLEEMVNEVLDESEEDEVVSDNDLPAADDSEEENGSSSSDSVEGIGGNIHCDALYIAKDGTNWRSEPYAAGRLGTENIINLRPG